VSYWEDRDAVEDAVGHRNPDRSISEQASRAEDDMAQFHLSQDRDAVIAREQAVQDEINRRR
jgi:hypothetical protein